MLKPLPFVPSKFPPPIKVSFLKVWKFSVPTIPCEKVPIEKFLPETIEKPLPWVPKKSQESKSTL